VFPVGHKKEYVVVGGWVGLYKGAMDVHRGIPYLVLGGGGVCCFSCCWDCGGFVFGVSCCSMVLLSVE